MEKLFQTWSRITLDSRSEIREAVHLDNFTALLNLRSELWFYWSFWEDFRRFHRDYSSRACHSSIDLQFIYPYTETFPLYVQYFVKTISSSIYDVDRSRMCRYIQWAQSKVNKNLTEQRIVINFPTEFIISIISNFTPSGFSQSQSIKMSTDDGNCVDIISKEFKVEVNKIVTQFLCIFYMSVTWTWTKQDLDVTKVESCQPQYFKLSNLTQVIEWIKTTKDYMK